LDKDVLPFRLLNLVTVSLSIFLNACFRFRRGDRVMVVTNPPALPYAVAVACWLRRANCYLYVNDLYPEILVAAGVAKERSLTVRIMAAASRWLWRRMVTVIAVGRDQAERIRSSAREHIDVIAITQPADTDLISARPRDGSRLLSELHLHGDFVFQFAGNIGRLQAIDDLVEAIDRVKDQDQVSFLFVGQGGRRNYLEKETHERGLTNVVLRDWMPRDQSDELHAACDVALISLVPGMKGVSVPSRIYSVLAAGRPILGVVDAASELGLLLEEHELGWRAEPGDIESLVQALRTAVNAPPERLREMGDTARRLAEVEYTTAAMIEKFAVALKVPG
jgi:glycosyltransferase involved in cell wall biosynthesis